MAVNLLKSRYEKLARYLVCVWRQIDYAATCGKAAANWQRVDFSLSFGWFVFLTSAYAGKMPGCLLDEKMLFLVGREKSWKLGSMMQVMFGKSFSASGGNITCLDAGIGILHMQIAGH